MGRKKIYIVAKGAQEAVFLDKDREDHSPLSKTEDLGHSEKTTAPRQRKTGDTVALLLR